jgi:cytochrome P450
MLQGAPEEKPLECHLRATPGTLVPSRYTMIPLNYGVGQDAVTAFLNGIVFRLYAIARGAAAEQFSVPIIADASTIHKILSEPARFPKNMGLLNALGDSRFNTEGANWEVRRDITQRAYSTAGTRQNTTRISAIYKANFAECEATAEGIQRALMLASCQIFFQALECDIDVEPLLGFFDSARQYVRRLQYYSWNSPSASDVVGLRDEGDLLVRDFRTEVFYSAALTKLMELFRSRAGDLEDFNPLDELLMNFFAGIETTAATLSFAINRLGVDARVLERLQAEVRLGRSEIYLNCFIQETMRYFPPIPFVVRQVASDVTIDDTPFTKGQTVILSIVGLHHNRKYWSDPSIFDCSRPEFITNSYDRRALIPFLSGPRTCGGAKLAKLELVEGLKAFVRQFNVSGQTDEIGFDYGLALRPGTHGTIKFNRLTV